MSTRVLLADDHPVLRQGLRKLLEQEDWLEVVGEAGDGPEAVEQASALEPDVIVMDIGLPSLNGIDAARRIRARHPKIRIVALSIHTSRRMVAEMLAAGADGYVFKMSAFEEVVRAIRAVLRGQRYLSPGAAEAMEAAHNGDQDASAFARLTPRERQVLQLLAEGSSSKQIAFDLGISPKTVDVHRKNVMDKLGLDSLADLTRYAMREGLITHER